MTDRPIIFSAPMVLALLAGTKTQTRRLATSPLRRCEVGDRLWAREAWSGTFWDPEDIDGPAREFWATPKVERTKDLSSAVYYWLAEEALPFEQRFVPEVQWTPSIHMPRWASRLTLIVEGEKVEPLQAISEPDAIAEGLIAYSLEGLPGHDVTTWHWQPNLHPEDTYTSGRAAYRALWSSLHTKEGERWEDNPWVTAISFRVEHGNIDRIGS